MRISQDETTNQVMSFSHVTVFEGDLTIALPYFDLGVAGGPHVTRLTMTKTEALMLAERIINMVAHNL